MKNKCKGVWLLIIKTCYKGSIIKIVWYYVWLEREQWDKIENEEIDSNMYEKFSVW